jgi:chromosome segregation ATPase
MQQKEKLNELISAIHEKDDLLDSQEDFLIKENKKHVKVKNAYALEVEKCEKLSSELSTCHETINNLRNENANLNAKVDSHVCNVSTSNPRDDNVDLLARIDELNVSLASLRIENEKLLAKAKDFDVDVNAIHDHMSLIKQQNDHIAKLDAKLPSIT